MKKREVIGVGIGPKADKGQLTFIEGVLTGIQEDVGANHSMLYELTLESGETQNVWGSTTIDQRIRQADLGNFCSIKFVGMEKGKSGRTYKNIEVEFWIGDPDDRVANWPGFRQAVGVGTEGPPPGEFPEDDEDDLAF